MSHLPYIVDRREIEYYASLMESGDANIQRDGLQRLFQETQKGRRLMPFAKQRIEPVLVRLIQSPIPKVRKWALHLATALDSRRIITACAGQLSIEHDLENVNWILAALSRFSGKKELEALLRKTSAENPLLDSVSQLQLNASTALFAKEGAGELSKTLQDLRHSEPRTRSWLTKFYGYRLQAQRRNMDGYVTQGDMLDLITDGDPGLQEYGMWALCLYGAQDTRQIPRDLLDDSSYHDDTLKWFFQFARYVPDLAFDRDRIASWIQRRASLNRSAREGLLKLLLCLDFSRGYVEPLVDWYIDEKYGSVKRLLIQYMASNVQRDDTETFFAVIEGEFDNAEVRSLIECEIRLNPGTALEIVDNRIQPKKGWTSMEKKYVLNGTGAEPAAGGAGQTFGSIDLSGSTITHLQIQQGTVNSTQSAADPPAFDYQAAAAFLERVREYELSDKEFGALAGEMRRILEETEAAVSGKESPSRIKGLLETLRDLAIGASGSLIASGIAAQIPPLIQQLGL